MQEQIKRLLIHVVSFLFQKNIAKNFDTPLPIIQPVIFEKKIALFLLRKLCKIFQYPPIPLTSSENRVKNSLFFRCITFIDNICNTTYRLVLAIKCTTKTTSDYSRTRWKILVVNNSITPGGTADNTPDHNI